MLSNAYFLAKFRFDTAENEPAKKMQNFTQKNNFANFAFWGRCTAVREAPAEPGDPPVAGSGGIVFVRSPATESFFF